MSYMQIDLSVKMNQSIIVSNSYNSYCRLSKSGNTVIIGIFAQVENLTGMDVILPAQAISSELRPKYSHTCSISGRNVGGWAGATFYPTSLRIETDGTIQLATGTNKNNVMLIDGIISYVL